MCGARAHERPVRCDLICRIPRIENYTSTVPSAAVNANGNSTSFYEKRTASSPMTPIGSASRISHLGQSQMMHTAQAPLGDRRTSSDARNGQRLSGEIKKPGQSNSGPSADQLTNGAPAGHRGRPRSRRHRRPRRHTRARRPRRRSSGRRHRRPRRRTRARRSSGILWGSRRGGRRGCGS